MPYPVKPEEFLRDKAMLESEFGLHFPQGRMYSVDAWRDPAIMAHDIALAMDAQPTLITTANAGIPTMLTSVISPKMVEIFTTKNKVADIYGEEQFGDWTSQTIMFPVVESTGYVSGYDDYSESGRADVNVDFPQRQAFRFQVITEYGDLENDLFSLIPRLNLIERKDIASARTMEKFANEAGFYGIAGLQNYGVFNDPSLPAALAPTTKAAGGTTWGVAGAPNAQPTEILFDIQKMLNGLITNSNGNVDAESDLTLAMHPNSQVFLNTPNSFGQTAMKMIKDSFPKIKIKTAVEFLNAGVYSAVLKADEIMGQQVSYTSFSYKMRSHGPVKGLSSWRQKKSAGVWGGILLQPFGIQTMTGI